MHQGRTAYGHLGLYWNPFGSVEHEDWTRLIVPQVDLDSLARQLRNPALALTFRGEPGRGKSTHLRALHAFFPEVPYTYLPPNASPRTPIPQARVLFVDEVERLSPRQRRKLYARPTPLALATR